MSKHRWCIILWRLSLNLSPADLYPLCGNIGHPWTVVHLLSGGSQEQSHWGTKIFLSKIFHLNQTHYWSQVLPFFQSDIFGVNGRYIKNYLNNFQIEVLMQKSSVLAQNIRNKLGLSCAKLSTSYASYPLAGSQLDRSYLSNKSLDLIVWIYKSICLELATH